MKTYMSRQRFTEIAGFDTKVIDECTIDAALERASDIVRQSLFVKKKYEFSSPDDKFRIDIPIADYDADGEITEDDIEIYEFDKDDYINPDTDRKDKILNFNSKYGYIVMDALYPTNNRTLVIESYIARFDNETMKIHLPEIVRLLATLYIFDVIPISKLQEGISSWNLNGVSVSFDLSSIDSIRQSIKEDIHKKFTYLKPIIYSTTKLGFDNDDRRRWGFDIRTPGGNRYRRM